VQNRVKQYRQAAGLTQRAVADAVGITRQTLSLIEKGDYNPSLRLCLGICYALGQTLDTVFWLPEGESNEESHG
jgi:putative transcriptional regulator